MFSSLIKIGIPPIQSLELCKSTASLLRSSVKEKNQGLISTSDIRSCVLRGINALQYSEKRTDHEINSWCISYIRRYGSDNNFVRVIDRREEKDLTVKYLKETILPHVITRITGGIPHAKDPTLEYKEVLSQSILGDLASISQKFCNQLNIYSLRYKTLIHLLQDYLQEPPHPVLVSPATQEKIVSYNIEKAKNHYIRIHEIINNPNEAIEEDEKNSHLVHSANECMMHSCAAILAYYGSYLGYEQKYGYIELSRIIKLYEADPEISCWYYCKIKNLSADLKKIDITVPHFLSILQRVKDFPATRKFNERTISMVDFFMTTSEKLVQINPVE